MNKNYKRLIEEWEKIKDKDASSLDDVYLFVSWLTANGYEIVKKEECDHKGTGRNWGGTFTYGWCMRCKELVKEEAYTIPVPKTPVKKECEACKSCVPTNTNCSCIHTCGKKEKVTEIYYCTNERSSSHTIPCRNCVKVERTPETPTLPEKLEKEEKVLKDIPSDFQVKFILRNTVCTVNDLIDYLKA